MVDQAVKGTIGKIIDWMRGDPNERIDAWLEQDEQSYINLDWFIKRCAENGWRNIEESPFEYADVDAETVAVTLYQAATSFFGGAKR